MLLQYLKLVSNVVAECPKIREIFDIGGLLHNVMFCPPSHTRLILSCLRPCFDINHFSHLVTLLCSIWASSQRSIITSDLFALKCANMSHQLCTISTEEDKFKFDAVWFHRSAHIPVSSNFDGWRYTNFVFAKILVTTLATSLIIYWVSEKNRKVKKD